MLSLSLDAARATDGLVTPAVGGAIVAAGYDRDFDRLPPDVGAVVPAAVPSWHSISLHGGGLLRTETDAARPERRRQGQDGRRRARARRARVGVAPAATSRRSSRSSSGFPAAAPSRSTAAGSPRRASRSAAGSRRRAAEPPDRPAHRPPDDGPWRDVTVAARSCLVADVAAKAALLLGAAGPAWLDERGLAGRFVSHDGAVTLNDSLVGARPETSRGVSPGVWYFARSAGIVAYLLLSSSVLLGVLMAGKPTFAWPRSRSRRCTASSRSSPASSSCCTAARCCSTASSRSRSARSSFRSRRRTGRSRSGSASARWS